MIKDNENRKMPEEKYKRLPGRERGFVGYYTLWTGKDHLLSICSMSFSEDYKRFYYADIQAIITRKTMRGKIYSIIFALIGGGFASAFAFAEGAWSVVYGIHAGLFFSFLLINLLRGPTCVCSVQTAVQEERLPSLKRLRTARKAAKLLKPLIEQAQGALVADSLRTKKPGL